jgi:hypothetical protein
LITVKRLLEKFMRFKHWIYGVTLLAVMTACSPVAAPADDTVEADSTAVVATNLPSSTPEATTSPTLTTPEEALQSTPETKLESECTLVSSLPDPPQEYAEVFAVTPDDWVLGPEDAAITIIEYGDFQ